MSELKLLTMVPLLGTAERSTLEGRPMAVGAFNVNFYTQAAGILEGLRRADAPGIVQASRGANKFQGGPDKISLMLKRAAEKSNHTLPICLHLDHGDEEKARECIDGGYSSVMIDASKFEFDENVAVTKRIVEYARKHGVSVEGEYDKLEGVEEDIAHEKTTYADPEKVPVLIELTGVNALAIAYGTSHGPNKGSNIEKVKTTLIKESYQNLKNRGMNENHFLVGHGSSTIPESYIDEINSYGGDIRNAHGVPMEKIQEGIRFGLRKINIDTDLRLGITAVFRKYFAENKGVEETSRDVLMPIKKVLDEKLDVIDPRVYLDPTDRELLRDEPTGTPLEEIMVLIKEKIASHVAQLCEKFGAAGMASKVEGQAVRTK